MSKSGITFQPKPEGNHYVTIHLAYKLITDGNAATAALLSVFEYLAESTLVRSPGWHPGQPMPAEIKIDGHCSNSLLMRLLDGLVKESSLKTKIKQLTKLGYIKTEIESARYRHVWYNYAAIAKALATPDLCLKGSKIDGSKIEDKGSTDNGKGSKTDGLRGQKKPATIPSTKPTTNPNPPQPPTGECETKPDLANDGNKPELDFLGEEVGANKKQPTGQDIYRAMKFPDVFQAWWSWYKAKICSIPEAHGKPKSSPGIKAKAGLDWLKLEESDFKGIGLAEFRLACQLYHKQAFETGGVGVQHGCRFLSGGAAGEPKWLELYQEAHAPATEATPDEFLGDVGESEHLSLSAQIGQQLKRLKISGLLPEAWQTETANFVSELEETGQREYLAHLRQQPDPAPLQFTQRIPEAA